jgi:DNA-binding transcriptional regulator YiaG
VREELGLTQAVMARACGVKLRQWQKWEYGERNPSASAVRLVEVMRELKKSGSKLFDHFVKQ